VRRVAVVVAAAALLVAVLLAAAGVGERAGALSNWQALVLGIVQGLTELLPISSSGHLILVPWLFDWTYLEEHADFNKTFDVALHLGTLVSVVVYFWRDVVELVGAWVRSVGARAIRSDAEERLGEPWQIAVLLAVFAVVLWVADRLPERLDLTGLTFWGALATGIAQSAALAPGVSRAGVTISMARALGLDRDAAARLSFLLLVPVVFGASVLTGLQDLVFGELPSGWAGPFVVGTIAAAVTGFAAIRALLGYVRRHDYSIFVVYRLLAAAAVLMLIATGAREATF
jgi:undecaprenyl-diphosphatase